jgi:hypothetical protein
MTPRNIATKTCVSIAYAVTALALIRTPAFAGVINNPSPDLSGLGNAQGTLNSVTNWIEGGCLAAIFMAFLISVASWSWGTHSRSPQFAESGKKGMVVSFAAAIVLAMGAVLINAAFGLGTA